MKRIFALLLIASALLALGGCQNNHNDDEIQEYTISMTKPFQESAQE